MTTTTAAAMTRATALAGLRMPSKSRQPQRVTRTQASGQSEWLMPRLDIPTLIVSDAAAFRDWLDANRDSSGGVWLVLAKKNTTDPTSLTYAQALEEALCQGWIDGQKRSRDATTFTQRFTPRRSTSRWSKRNVDLAERLIADSRMLPSGLVEIERAKADGRWAAAYSGQAAATVPAD